MKRSELAKIQEKVREGRRALAEAFTEIARREAHTRHGETQVILDTIGDTKVNGFSKTDVNTITFIDAHLIQITSLLMDIGSEASKQTALKIKDWAKEVRRVYSPKTRKSK
jgi:hypothetical protein